MIYDVRLQRLELILVSHNVTFYDTGHNFARFRQIPPTQTNESNARFSARRVEWGYGDA